MNKYIKINYKVSEKIRNTVLNGDYIPKSKYDTISCDDYYDEKWWNRLSEKERKLVLDWVDNNMKPIKSINLRRSSYQLKHICENDVGFYIHNDVIKKAMAIKGYEIMPHYIDSCFTISINWYFNISEKSLKGK